MAVKTITITEDAYRSLKAKKTEGESFSKTIIRMVGKRSLREFAGALSKKSADELENAIKEIRRRHTESHIKRVKNIAAAFEEMKNDNT